MKILKRSLNRKQGYFLWSAVDHPLSTRTVRFHFKLHRNVVGYISSLSWPDRFNLENLHPLMALKFFFWINDRGSSRFFFNFIMWRCCLVEITLCKKIEIQNAFQKLDPTQMQSISWRIDYKEPKWTKIASERILRSSKFKLSRIYESLNKRRRVSDFQRRLLGISFSTFFLWTDGP